MSQFILDATASNVLMLCKWCFSERHAFPPEKAKECVNCNYKKLRRYLQAHKIILLHAMDNAEFTIANNSSLHCPKFGRLFFFHWAKNELPIPLEDFTGASDKYDIPHSHKDFSSFLAHKAVQVQWMRNKATRLHLCKGAFSMPMLHLTCSKKA